MPVYQTNVTIILPHVIFGCLFVFFFWFNASYGHPFIHSLYNASPLWVSFKNTLPNDSSGFCHLESLFSFLSILTRSSSSDKSHKWTTNQLWLVYQGVLRVSFIKYECFDSSFLVFRESFWERMDILTLSSGYFASRFGKKWMLWLFLPADSRVIMECNGWFDSLYQLFRESFWKATVIMSLSSSVPRVILEEKGCFD